MRTALALILVASLAACRSSKPAATPAPAPSPAEPPAGGGALSDAELEALMREAVAFFAATADAAASAGADCAAMAQAIDRVVAGHQDFLTRAHRLDESPDASDRAEQWMTAHDDEIKPTFDRLTASLEPCREDAAVQAAMEKLSQ